MYPFFILPNICTVSPSSSLTLTKGWYLHVSSSLTLSRNDRLAFSPPSSTVTIVPLLMCPIASPNASSFRSGSRAIISLLNLMVNALLLVRMSRITSLLVLAVPARHSAAVNMISANILFIASVFYVLYYADVTCGSFVTSKTDFFII